jgi:predicted PurR-regulated permease PerM
MTTPEQADPERVQRSVRRALWLLVMGAGMTLLHFARDLMIPLLLAALLALVLSGIVERLRRIGVPRALSALLLLILICGATIGTLDALWTPAQRWMVNAPRVLRTVEHRLRPAQVVMREIDAITRRARAIADPDPGSAPPVVPAAPTPSVSALELLAGTGSFAGELAVGLALALLLLAAGPARLAGMTAALVEDWQAHDAQRVIEAVRTELARYYGTLALINVAFGLVVGVMMWLFGMPNPMLWGVLAGVLNFIPYLGCAATLTILTLVSLVTFQELSHTLIVAASFLAAAGVEGHIVEPIFFGRRFQLNPIVIVLALWVGGWMWGIAGVVFTVPTLVAAKAAASHSRRGGPLVRLLGPVSPPPLAARRVGPGDPARIVTSS